MAGAAKLTASDELGMRRWIKRHERALAAAWIAGCALLVAGLAVWGIALNGAERAVDRWSAAWIASVERAAQELERGDAERASARLEDVLRTNGVRSVKHRFDKEHERALGLLAQAYAAQDRKSKTLATLEQLVAFDPRNFDNHWRQAKALRSFDELGLAKEAFERVLAIHPTHWPSVEARIAMEYAAGAYGPIPELYERYLEAWLLARLRLVAGESEAWIEVQANGLAQEFVAEVPLELGWKGAPSLETRGYSAHVESLELIPAVRVGEAGLRPGIKLAGGDVSASDTTSRFEFGEVELPAGAQRFRLRVTLFKRLTPQTWAQVRKAYQNTLQHERLERATQRSRVGGCEQAGTVFED